MKEYHKTIFFTKVPIEGVYKYKDIFQIYPAQLESQPFSRYQEHFPGILEYWTSEEDKLNLENKFDEAKTNLNELYERTGMKINKEDRILALLSTFTNNIFFRYSSTEGSWGIPMLHDELTDDINNWSSKWCEPLFHFPELPPQLILKEFTKVQLKQIQRIEHADYYFNEPNLDFKKNKPLTLPSSINWLFDNYYALTTINQKNIDTACSHIFSALKVKNNFKTLSLIASFTAIETMISLEFKDHETENCKSCGQVKYKVAAKFRIYLLRYIGNSVEYRKKFNALYSLRSKIIHNGILFSTEKLFSDLPKQEKFNLEITFYEILQYGKLSIINWLLLKESLDHHTGQIKL